MEISISSRHARECPAWHQVFRVFQLLLRNVKTALF